jgi:hypothetical protein
MYANWRYEPAQKALIQLATDPAADALDRLNATDAIGYAVRLQVKGVRQDPPMFQALVSLLRDKEEPVRSAAAGILAPIYEPSGEGAQRRRSPEGGWEKWIEQITALDPGARKHYEACASAGSGNEPVDLFCRSLKASLPDAFQYTLKAAEAGYVPAQSTVAMMYANGKGVEQNYAEAGKWWGKAAEGGDLRAARHVWNLYRNGEGVARDAAIANRWAPVIGEPVSVPRTNRSAAPGTPAPTGASAAGPAR